MLSLVLPVWGWVWGRKVVTPVYCLVIITVLRRMRARFPSCVYFAREFIP